MQKRAVVIVAVFHKKVLLVQKGNEPWTKLSGEWALPAETLEAGENDIDAVRRGMLEEANLEVVDIQYLTSNKSYAETDVGWFVCEVINADTLCAGDDAIDANWYTPNDALSIYGNLPSHPLPGEVIEFLKAV